MRIALTVNPVTADRRANIETIFHLSRRAAEDGVGLVVFGEIKNQHPIGRTGILFWDCEGD